MAQLEQYDFSGECSRGTLNKLAGKRLAEEILRLDATVSYDLGVAAVSHYSKMKLPPYFESVGAQLSRHADGHSTLIVAELTLPKAHIYIDTATVTVTRPARKGATPAFDISRLERCWVENFYNQANNRLPSHFTAAATLHALASGLSVMRWVEQQSAMSPEQAHSPESVL